MDAVMQAQAEIDTTAVESLSTDQQFVGVDFAGDMASDMAEFLRDPIGFGDFDFADPISLTEFCTRRHFHGVYAAPLS